MILFLKEIRLNQGRSITRIGTILIPLLFLVFSLNARSETSDQVVKNVAENLINQVKTDKSLSGNKPKIAEMVDREVTPYIDFNSICTRSLGKSIAMLDDAQKTEYTGLCKKIIINTYSIGLTDFKNIAVKVLPPKVQANGDELVNTIVSQDGEDDIHVDFLMHNTANGWIAEEFHIDGISIVSNLFNQFHAMLVQDGAVQFIEHLKSKLTKN